MIKVWFDNIGGRSSTVFFEREDGKPLTEHHPILYVAFIENHSNDYSATDLKFSWDSNVKELSQYELPTEEQILEQYKHTYTKYWKTLGWDKNSS